MRNPYRNERGDDPIDVRTRNTNLDYLLATGLLLVIVGLTIALVAMAL